jgi:hypothetical protein
MKNFLVITILFFLIFLFSCSGDKIGDKKCLPASILIVYLGEENKPTYPLLINTDAKDTSYLKFVGGGKEKFDKYGFDISENYFRISTVSYEVYDLLKSYILTHNTHKDRNLHNASSNTIKIVLSDHCDFLMYAIDKTEKGYFSKMLEAINLKNDDELQGYIKYYQEIQEWDGN